MKGKCDVPKTSLVRIRSGRGDQTFLCMGHGGCSQLGLRGRKRMLADDKVSEQCRRRPRVQGRQDILVWQNQGLARVACHEVRSVRLLGERG
jgi:hypothetical protein